MPARTQITRHDCVEGWSCIGKWKGVPLGLVLDQAGDKLLEMMLRTANGRLTAAEALGHREFVLTRLYESA